MATERARVQEALSPEESYARELERLMAQVDRLEEQAVRRAMDLLTEASRRIVAVLAEVPDDAYLASYLPRLQREIEAQMARYQREYEAFLTEESRTWATLGTSLVDTPLAAAGASSLVVSLPSLEPRFLDILQGYRTSLITGVTDQVIDRISTELQLGVLGGKTPFELQRTVADLLSTQADAAGAFHGVAARAEAVVRTELNRVFNMATQSRQAAMADRMAQVFPAVTPRKRWLNAGDGRVRPAHRRQALLDQRPAVDEDFLLTDADGQTWPALYPHDPRLPASLSVNCRCRAMTDLDSLTPILEGA